MPRYYTYKPGTKGSGLKLRPNQHLGFREGEGYYAAPGRATPRPTPKPNATANRPLDVNAIINSYFQGAMLTPQQQRAEARRQTNDAIAEQMKAFEKERARARQENQNRQLTSVGLAAAMSALKGADADAVRQAWQQAGGNMTSFASALTGGLQEAQQGALSSAQQGLTGGSQVIAPDPGANAAVANALGGTIPAATAARNAETQYQAALERGDAQAARWWDQQRAIEYEGREAEGEFAGKFAEIQALRPKLLREAEAAQQTRAREELATLMSVLNVKSGLQKSDFEMQEARAKLGQGQQKIDIARTAEERKEKERQDAIAKANADRKVRQIAANASATNAATARSKALGIDQATGKLLPGFKAGPNGTAVKDEKQKEKWADSVKREQDFRKWATQWFKDNYFDPDLGEPAERPPKKKVLVDKMMQAMGNSLVGNGLTREGVRLWAWQVLNSFYDRYWNPNYYKPRAGAGTTTTTGGGAIPGL